MTPGPDSSKTRGMLRQLVVRVCAGLLAGAVAVGCGHDDLPSEATASVDEELAGGAGGIGSGAAGAPGAGGQGACDPAICEAPGTCTFCDGNRCRPRPPFPQQACRPAAGPCDVAEYCQGGRFCPRDVIRGADVPCGVRASKICDRDDVCDGKSVDCTDRKQPNTFVCRQIRAGAPCDKADTCTGSSDDCPDTFQPSSLLCRSKSAECDVPDYCTGSAPDCPSDEKALDGTACSDARNVCLIPGTTTCLAGSCSAGTSIVCAAAPGQCLEDGVCDATLGCQYPPKDDGTPCDDGIACTAGDQCLRGLCEHGSETDSLCPTDLDCATVTCDVTATLFPDRCRIVPLPATTICRPAATADVCDRDETCDGGTRCPPDDVKPAGSLCLPASCSAFQQQSALECDGTNKKCPPATPVSCAGYGCDGVLCRQSCDSDADCDAQHYYCVNHTCEQRIRAGQTCRDDSQCSVSNPHCIDGVCCDKPCNGQCEACDVGGQEGTCTAVTGAPHGARPACRGDASACRGVCAGQLRSACVLPSAKTVCIVPSCDEKTNLATERAFCDGVGNCAATEPVSCAPFSCAGEACRGDCVTDAECASSAYCKAGVCQKLEAPGARCARDSQCDSGFCTDGVCCESRCQGQCEACGEAGRCAPVSGAPVGARPACSGDQAGACAGHCDGAARLTCAYPAAEITCREASCDADEATLAGHCTGGGSCAARESVRCENGCSGARCAGDACLLASDCANGERCVAGSCAPLGSLGSGCALGQECDSGFCIDGVCCDRACDGQCEACDGAEPGSCGPVTGAPHGARVPCGGDGSACAGSCDGKTAEGCSYPVGTVCQAGSCSPGTQGREAVAKVEALCDGSGRCPAQASQACAAFGCDAEGKLCDGPCADGSACPDGQFCAAGVCVTTLPLGDPCQGAQQCASGFCVDGYCCGSACEDRCAACDVPGALGQCSAVRGGTHGGRPGCAGTGVCGAQCDGRNVTACVFAGEGESCGAAACSDGVVTAASSCDGNGRCRDAEQTACDTYACDGAACGSGCQSDADCTRQLQCQAGKCVPPFKIKAVDAGTCGCVVVGGSSSPRAAWAGLALAGAWLWRRRRLASRRTSRARGRRFGARAALVASGFASQAAAQQSLDQSFPAGVSLQRFEPAPAGDRFFVVPAGDVPQGTPGVRAQLLAHAALGPLLVRKDAVSGSTRRLISRQLLLHPALSYAPLPWLLLHLDAPLALVQHGQGPSAPEAPALADARLGVRFAVYGSEHAPFALGPALDFWVPLGSQKNLLSDGSPRALPRVNASGELSWFRYAVSAGFQFRKHVDSGSLEVGNSLVTTAAVGVSLFEDAVCVGPEFQAAWLARSDHRAFAARSSPLELLFGARLRRGDWVVGAGAGPSLSDAPGAAPRAVISVAYAPRLAAPKPERAPVVIERRHEAPPPVVPPAASPSPAPEPDADGDGVSDVKDACPDESGAASADPASSGCPERPAVGKLADHAEITFSGYRALPGGRGVLFVELTEPVAVEVSRSGQVVEYRLVGATVPLKNNQNPLLLDDFSASAVTASLVVEKPVKDAGRGPARSASVKLVVTLRGQATPAYRLVSRGGGAALEVELPAEGSAPSP